MAANNQVEPNPLRWGDLNKMAKERVAGVPPRVPGFIRKLWLSSKGPSSPHGFAPARQPNDSAQQDRIYYRPRAGPTRPLGPLEPPPSHRNTLSDKPPPSAAATLRIVNLRDFEEKVRRLPGVEAARVVTEGGAVTEVHVLTGMGKAAKQVVRDVQSLAQAVFGLAIDRRVVSVVQLPDPDLAQGDRPVIVDVSEQMDGNHTRVVVTLGWQGDTLVGEVGGAAAHTTRNRLVAEATIEALQQALQDSTAIGVAAVDLPVLGSRSVAIAQIVMVTEGAERLMVGSALVDGESSRAVVRAVLDALNRHIPELRR